METKISKDLNICNSVIFYSWVIFNVTVSYFIPGFHLYLEGVCKYLALMVLLTWNIVNFGFFFAREFCASLELDSILLCAVLQLHPRCIWKAFIDIQHLLC